MLALNAATLAGKLLQLSNGAVYDEFHNIRVIHDKKLDALEDLIEAANGKPVLVMYAYQHDLTRIQQRFGKYGPENPNGVRELKTSADLEATVREMTRLTLFRCLPPCLAAILPLRLKRG